MTSFYLILLESWTCESYEYRCSNGTPVCISRDAVCDRNIDCEDNADEDPELCGEFQLLKHKFNCIFNCILVL